MKSVAFIDTEIEPKSKRLVDLGAVKGDGQLFHKNTLTDFTAFLRGCEFVAGHNIIKHDLNFAGRAVAEAGIPHANAIDTLFWSPLLFPTHPYHALLKDDKLQTDEMNNPLNDATKAKDLFFDEVTAFWALEPAMQQIFYGLLHRQREFEAFFRFLGFSAVVTDLEQLIRDTFADEICAHAPLRPFISDQPIA